MVPDPDIELQEEPVGVGGTVSEDEEIEEPYAENTPLTWVFGDHPRPKLVAAFLSEASIDIDIRTATDLAGINRSTFYNHGDNLIQHDIIEQTREVGSSSLFQLRTDESHVQLVAKLESALLDEWYEGHSGDSTADSSSVQRETFEEALPEIEEPYADDTPLTWVFGDQPQTKIVAAFLSEHSNSMNVTDTATVAGVSRNSVYEHLETLLDHGIVVHDQTVGGSDLYTINTELESVKLLAELEHDLLRRRVGEEFDEPGESDPS